MAGPRGREPIPVPDGEKWCTKCKTSHPLADFGRDSTRRDGLAAKCRDSQHTGHPRGWHGRTPVNPVTGRPGPLPQSGRDGDKIQARQHVNLEVRNRRRPHPNSLPCVDCGHVWSDGERRHTYDHFLGYESGHHYDVDAVCTTCHSRRSWNRWEATSSQFRTDIDVAALINLYEHNTLQQVAAISGVAEETVRRRLLKAGLPMRKKGASPDGASH